MKELIAPLFIFIATLFSVPAIAAAEQQNQV